MAGYSPGSVTGNQSWSATGSVSLNVNANSNTDDQVREPLRAYHDMEVYVRMTSAIPIVSKLYERVLVQSMQYFWSDITSMVVVLDNEKTQDHDFGNNIIGVFPFPKICYMDDLTVPGYSGHDRMQRDMFYPERCTSKKYVAFVDTDTMFITRIVPEMLFTQDKPIIIAVYGSESRFNWRDHAQTTTNLFQTKEATRCMSYFPVVVKVDHVVELRHYLEKLHGMPFDELLLKLKTERFSQFNIMCHFLWMFHRSEYDFHFQLQVTTTSLRSSFRVNKRIIEKSITEAQRRPIPRVALHFKHSGILKNWHSKKTYTEYFRYSICFGGGFEECPEKCSSYNTTSVRMDMFKFDRDIDWRWDTRCMEAQKDHYRKLAKYASAEYTSIIRRACNEIYTLTW